MNVITVTGHARVASLMLVLESLRDQGGSWAVMLGLDDPTPEVSAVDWEPLCRWVTQRSAGKERNQRGLVEEMVNLGSPWIACLQDDTVPEPGAVLQLEAYTHFLSESDVGLLAWPKMGLYAGGEIVFEPTPVGKSLIQDVGAAFCADGFVASAECYRKWLLPNWNGPTDFRHAGGRYVGWDWSLLSAMRRHRLRAFAPLNPLIRNVGYPNGRDI